MILAAGKGTRLQPLTHKMPKALIKIGDQTLLEHIIAYLKKYGITDIIMNISHFSDQITEYVSQKNNFDINICFSNESDELLDTGGGLKKAGWFFENEENILLISGDILTNLNLENMISHHTVNKNFITLAVKDRDTSRSLLFNDKLVLTGWRDNRNGEQKLIRNQPVKYSYGFSTVHLINTKIFDLFPDKRKFSIIDFYLDIGHKINICGYEHHNDIWIEFGRFSKLEETLKSKELKEIIDFIST